jgi:hypothetical protein
VRHASRYWKKRQSRAGRAPDYGTMRPGTLPRMKATKTLIPAALGALALVPATAAAHAPGPVAHAARLGHKIVLYKSIGTPGASPTTQFGTTHSKVTLIDVQTTFNDG